MKSYGEMHEVLEEADEMFGEMGYEDVEMTMVGGGSLLYHVDKAGVDIDRNSTDDVDLLTGDAMAVMDLADKYASKNMKRSGVRVPVSKTGDKNIDFLFEHPMMEDFLGDYDEGYRVEDLENMEVKVLSPEDFIRDKKRLSREKDINDISRMEKVIEAYRENEFL